MVVTVKFSVFWNVTQCSLMGRYQRFGGTCHLYLYSTCELLSVSVIRVPVFVCFGRYSCCCRDFYCCLGNEEPSFCRSSLLPHAIHLACISFIKRKSVSIYEAGLFIQAEYNSHAGSQHQFPAGYAPLYWTPCPLYTHFIPSMRSASLTCDKVQSLFHNRAFVCSSANRVIPRSYETGDVSRNDVGRDISSYKHNVKIKSVVPDGLFS
jgi:hypothetical protein